VSYFISLSASSHLEDDFGGLSRKQGKEKEREGATKSSKEIYAEMIQKSKTARSQAQKQRALLHDETATLDDGFDELAELLGRKGLVVLNLNLFFCFCDFFFVVLCCFCNCIFVLLRSFVCSFLNFSFVFTL
jgi:hypothetical protein